MLIDWFTVVAEAVNFLILVGLLKHFLYGPLLAAIDAREQRIEASLAEAGRKKKEADALAAEAQAQTTKLETIRDETIDKARKEAERQRQEMIDAARESVRAMEARWQEDLRREKDVFLLEIRRAAAAGILAVARSALADLASAELERSAVYALLQKLRAMDPAALREFAGQKLEVASAAELSSDLRGEIEDAVTRRVGAPVALSFERAPGMAWGIELRGAGQRIGWTPGAYVDSLEEKLRAAIEDQVELGSSLAAA